MAVGFIGIFINESRTRDPPKVTNSLVRGITVRGGNEIHLSRAVVEDGEVSKEREIFLLRFFSLSFEYRIIDRFAIIRGKRKKRKNLETRMHGALMKYLIAGGGKGEGRGG